MLGETGSTGGRGKFVWTQEIIDETIAMYEGFLQEIKEGKMYSKTVDGDDTLMMSCNPADIESGRWLPTKVGAELKRRRAFQLGGRLALYRGNRRFHNGQKNQ